MKKRSKHQQLLSSVVVITITVMSALVVLLIVGLIDRNLFITMSLKMFVVTMALTVLGVVILTLFAEKELK